MGTPLWSQRGGQFSSGYSAGPHALAGPLQRIRYEHRCSPPCQAAAPPGNGQTGTQSSSTPDTGGKPREVHLSVRPPRSGGRLMGSSTCHGMFQRCTVVSAGSNAHAQKIGHCERDALPRVRGPLFLYLFVNEVVWGLRFVRGTIFKHRIIGFTFSLTGRWRTWL